MKSEWWVVKGIVALTAVAALVASATPAAAQAQGARPNGSLWGGSSATLISKKSKPPLAKNDLITVLVSERTQARAQATLKTDRRTQWEAALDEWIKIHNLKLDEGLQDGQQPEIDLDARLRQDNVGTTNRSGEFTTTIQARVVDVRPNGLLVIEAQKSRTVNGETEEIKLSGVVDARDVSSDRVVRSDKVAEQTVSYTGTGTVGDSQKRGWLGWLLDTMWPF